VSKPFSYSTSEIGNIEAALSRDRFTPYVAEVNDRRVALALYEWNSLVSAALYVPLQNVEIAMRNNFHRELSRLFGSAWPADVKFLALNPRFHSDVFDATDRLRRRQLSVDTQRIVEELPFGFWTTMLGRRYEHSLWAPALRAAFPRFRLFCGRTPSRNEIASRFDYLRELRNRIAHHEPIFQRNLRADYESLLEAARWMHEDLAEWTDRFCGCAWLLAKGQPRPHTAENGAWCGPALLADGMPREKKSKRQSYARVACKQS
jgi:hypothetical protein